MNRKEIKKALNDYLKAKKELEEIEDKIANDQTLKKLRSNRETRKEYFKALSIKYPNRINIRNKVDNAAINLIKIMVENTEFKNENPESIYHDKTTFQKLLKLANDYTKV